MMVYMDAHPTAIVIANENDAAIQAASSTLTKAGFLVRHAASGETALGLTRQLEEPAKLALVDEAATEMPIAGLVDGLRESSPNIRILVLSDRGRGDGQRFSGKGLRTLKKPFRRSALLGQVLDLMERPLVLTA
jgi:DNA-binding response OmpR family regulator